MFFLIQKSELCKFLFLLTTSKDARKTYNKFFFWKKCIYDMGIFFLSLHSPQHQQQTLQLRHIFDDSYFRQVYKFYSNLKNQSYLKAVYGNWKEKRKFWYAKFPSMFIWGQMVVFHIKVKGHQKSHDIGKISNRTGTL